MTTFLPKEVQDGLDRARREDRRKRARLRVTAGDRTFPVLDLSEGGFSLDIEDAPKLRGLVDLYDGARHLSRCLIVASEEDGAVMRYEYKRATAVTDRAALDFVRDLSAPVALITGGA